MSSVSVVAGWRLSHTKRMAPNGDLRATSRWLSLHSLDTDCIKNTASKHFLYSCVRIRCQGDVFIGCLFWLHYSGLSAAMSQYPYLYILTYKPSLNNPSKIRVISTTEIACLVYGYVSSCYVEWISILRRDDFSPRSPPKCI
jgi:hypothetical protein